MRLRVTLRSPLRHLRLLYLSIRQDRLDSLVMRKVGGAKERAKGQWPRTLKRIHRCSTLICPKVSLAWGARGRQFTYAHPYHIRINKLQDLFSLASILSKGYFSCKDFRHSGNSQTLSLVSGFSVSAPLLPRTKMIPRSMFSNRVISWDKYLRPAPLIR